MKKLIIALFTICIMLTTSLAATVTLITFEGKVTMTVDIGSEVELLSTGANSGWKVIKGEVEIIDNKFIMPSQDLEIIEVNDMEYTITYDLNDGTVAGNNPTTYRMTTNDITLINPTKPGCDFIGWIGSGLKETTKIVTIPKGSAGNRKYEAIWKAEKYNIKYITDSKLPENYIGLSHIESNGTEYIDTGIIADQDTSINIVAEASSIVDAENGYGFIPYGAGEKYDKRALECYSYNSALEFNYENQYDFFGTAKANKTITINHNKNTVSYSIDGNNYSKTFNYANYTTPYTLTLFALHRETIIIGDAMKLYSCKIYDNGTLVRDFIPCINPNNEVGLYDVISQTFFRNEGTGAFKASETYEREYTAESNDIVLPTPGKIGNVFTGWTGSNGATPSTAVTIPKGSIGNKTYTANWNKNKYAVKYNPNGGTGTTTSSSHEYEVAKNLTTNGFSKNGYTFKGWDTSSTGMNVVYTNGQTVMNLASTNGTTVNLYAVWEEDTGQAKYTVTTIAETEEEITGTYTNHKCSTCGGYDHECSLVNIFIITQDSIVTEN